MIAHAILSIIGNSHDRAQSQLVLDRLKEGGILPL